MKDSSPVAVIKIKVRCPLLPDYVGAEWYIVRSPFRKPTHTSTEEDALAFIKKHNLTLAYSSKDGRVYDSSDQSFLARWGGLTPDQQANIDTIWK